MRNDPIVALGAARYRVERPWGSLPAGSGRVSDVSVDAQGRVLVLLRYDRAAGESGPAIVALGPDGAALAAWGEREVFDGHMMTCAPDGRVYVVDRDAHEVIAFDGDGRVLARLGARHRPLEPLNHPTDVAIAPDGDLLVADGYAASRVHRFAPDGTYRGAWGEHGTRGGAMLAPHALWALGDGRVAVVDRDSDRVLVFGADGAFLSAIGAFYRPAAIWGDPADRLYVTDSTPSLTVLTPQGETLGRCRPVSNGAHGLWAVPDGTIYLAEGTPSRITRLVPLEEGAG